MTLVNERILIERPVRRLPGPKGLPLLGIMLDVHRDPLRFFTDLEREFGDVVHFNLGLDPVVMLNHPRDIKHVLQDNHENYHKSKFYKPLQPLLGGGMFLSEGKTWLEQRRTARPAFQGPRFDALANDIVSATTDMLEGWETHARNRTSFDAMEAMMKLTLDVVMRAFFSTKFTSAQANVYDALTVMLKRAEYDVWSPLSLPQWVPTRGNREYREALAELDAFIYGVLEQRRKDPGEHHDLLSMLLAWHAVNGRADKLLRDHILSLSLAGHETTANALSWAWYLLSEHPDVRARLQAEFDQVLGGRKAGFADLAKLDYARKVFEETLRLYPPVWTISRAPLADDATGSAKIRKGTTVMLSPYVVHRRREYWPDPERFDPERFTPEMVAIRPQHGYFPFGGGPRTCLGNRFGMMEGQLIMATIMQRFTMTLDPDCVIEPEPMITLRPRNGVHVTVAKRRTLH